MKTFHKSTTNASASYDIKRINRSRIMQLFCRNTSLSRRDIQDILKLSLPTISQNISELLEAGLITKVGNIGYTGGRTAESFAINSMSRLAVGLDITRNHISTVLVDLLGNIIAKTRVKYRFSRSEEYFQELCANVNNILETNNVPRENVLGVGLGLPALTDIDNTRIVYAKILELEGLTAEDFSSCLGFEVKLFNDANAACFAELHGIEVKEESGFYIMLSNNVGGAVFLNNSVYIGDNFRSGEVGHLIIHQDGAQCYCGQKGCLDPYCSATVLSDMTDGNLDLFFELLESGDADAEALWDEYLKNLAIAVRNVRILFDCPIIIGGYVGARIDEYMPRLRALVDEYSTFDSSSDFVKPCRFKTASIAAGSALSFISEFLGSI